jgi:hypothetical protein
VADSVLTTFRPIDTLHITNLTNIMVLMEVTMTPTLESTQNGSADILEAGKFHSLGVHQALGEVRAVLSNGPSQSRAIFAVIVHGEHRPAKDLNYLTVVNTFLKAYWKGWTSLSRLASEHKSAPRINHLRTLHDPGSNDICVYWGRTDAKDVREKMDTSPGVYVIPSHMDSSLLESLGLPHLPKRFQTSPLVIQCKLPNGSLGEGEQAESPWKTLTEALNKKSQIERKIENDSLEWRDHFVSDYPCLTSAEVAQESSSAAKNRSAIASRWLGESKIFSIQHGRRLLFPKFQFTHGSPLPIISKLMEVFPKHSTGWDYAFFLTSPNTFLGGAKPIELLKTKPDELLSLAHSFVNPADAF